MSDVRIPRHRRRPAPLRHALSDRRHRTDDRGRRVLLTACLVLASAMGACGGDGTAAPDFPDDGTDRWGETVADAEDPRDGPVEGDAEVEDEIPAEAGCAEGSTCLAGVVETRACSCGEESRTCALSCTWGPWSGCEPGECAPGASEDRACGACATGTQGRTCATNCTWGPWSDCAGAETGFPERLEDGAPVCPPYDRPAVFFAPHPDDETIGMAGAIAEHFDVGRPVFVELLTHGEGSDVRAILNDGESCRWHSGSHVYDLDPEELGDARLLEFRDALAGLGVTGIHISDFGDGDVTAAEARTRVDWWLARAGSAGLSLKSVVGSQDPRVAGGTGHDDHIASWTALTSSGFGDVRGYYVYHYVIGVATPDSTVRLGTAWCTAKRTALDAYRLWSPAAGRYAVGYHSVPRHIDAADTTCVEYLQVP